MSPKAIIISAGPTRTGKYRFPPKSKPKSLFHYKGEVILEHQLRVFRACGIKSFRLVVGYRSEDLIAHNKKKGLGLEIIYNQDWEKNLFQTIRLALKGLDEDVIMTWGDTIFLLKPTLEKFLSSKDPLAILSPGDPKTGRGSPDVFKISRGNLPLVRRLEEYDIANGREIYEGNRVARALRRLVKENEGFIMYAKGTTDIDFYGQTDEGKGF